MKRQTKRTVVGRINRAASMIVGRRIENRRLSRGLTQGKLAERAGYSGGARQAIDDIEKGRVGVGLGALYALAMALETEPWDLLPPAAMVLFHAKEYVEKSEEGLRVRS